MTTPRIFQINISSGGVPKLAVPTSTVTTDGIKGDKQQDLKHHGGPDRALCLYSLERILALQEEGHPIFPGATGENLTLVGLDWDLVIPGSRLQLGNDVQIEVLSYTEPCASIKQYFSAGKISIMLQEKNPGWSRVYAKVLAGGPLAVGDKARILTD